MPVVERLPHFSNLRLILNLVCARCRKGCRGLHTAKNFCFLISDSYKK